jgi:hypothetical protein
MSRSEIEYLRHIQDEARYLIEAGREVSWQEFSNFERWFPLRALHTF